MTPREIEINGGDQAAVPSAVGHIHQPMLAKTNDSQGKHLDNELYNDG